MSGSTSDFNSKRFPGKPLRQPLYEFDSIPKCKKNLEGSTIYEITNREDYIASMAEMVLLCKEAMKRAKSIPNGKRTSKPLSLEYIADRMDIDDPLWGYFVRDDKNSRMQGFITFTTFTNWQRSFRWDSISDMAFCYDSPELAQQVIEGERVCDDGSLAAELQQTVRCGDVYNEGIVWPRIAEISLLGGLGCGKVLVEQAIEKLETMKANSLYNYDYVVLQATEKSIPFYESLGFVRVGAVEIDEKFAKKDAAKKAATSSDTETDESTEGNAPLKVSTAVEPPSSEIVSNANELYEVKRAGETVAEIAKKFGVDVWDVVFLNQGLYKNLKSRSYLKQGTNLYIPLKDAIKADSTSLVQTRKDLKESSSDAFQWYIAKENDTPKGIAFKFGVSCRELVSANIDRLPELLPISRLKEGTRVRVSHFDQHDDVYVPYTHWTSPDDDKQETLDPSYMMVKKLKRQSSTKRAITSQLVSRYVSPPSSLFHHVKGPLKIPNLKERKKKLVMESFAGPGKPKRPLSAYIMYCNDNRKSLLRTMRGQPASEYSKVLAMKWKKLGNKEKTVYQQRHKEAKKQYEKDVKEYEQNLERFFKKHPEMRPKYDEESEVEGTLFNQVVTLKSNTPGSLQHDSKYFYVLTYIPDLVWCHLAPMRQVGHWGSDKPECQGRPKWMLVDESEGQELDISADYCTLVPSRGIYRTEDADDERWDIFCERSRPGKQCEGDEARVWEDPTEDSTESESSVESISKSGRKRRRRSEDKKSILEKLPASKRPKPSSADFTPVRCSKSTLNGETAEQELSSTKSVQGGKSPKTCSHSKSASIVETGKVIKKSRGRPPRYTIQSKINIAERTLTVKSATRHVTPEDGIRTKSSPGKRSVLENLSVSVENSPSHSNNASLVGTGKAVKKGRGRPPRQTNQSKINLTESALSPENAPRDITPEEALRRSLSGNQSPPNRGGKGVVNEPDVFISAHQQEQKLRVLPRRKANSSREGFYSERSPKKQGLPSNSVRSGSRKREASSHLSYNADAKKLKRTADTTPEPKSEVSVAPSLHDIDDKKSNADVRVLPRRKANSSREGFYSESSPSRKGIPINALRSESAREKRSKNQACVDLSKSPKKPATKDSNTPSTRRSSPRKSTRDFSRSGKSTLMEHSLNIDSRHVIGRRLVVS